MNEDFNVLSKKFSDLLSLTINDYLLWKYIRDYINKKSETSLLIDEQYSDFFTPVLISFQDRFILHLANLLDGVKEDENKKVISIYELLEFVKDNKKKISINKKLEKLKHLKEKLNNWRNKYIAHKDYKFGLNGYEEFIKKNKISFDDIYKLMIKLGKIYDDIYNSINKDNKISTWFSSLEIDLGVGRLFNHIEYFVPKTNEERVSIISKEIIKNIELKGE